MNPSRIIKSYSRQYEYKGPFTYGGPAGTYMIQTPYNDAPCEYRVTMVNGTALIVLSPTPFWVPNFSGPFNATTPGMTAFSDQTGMGMAGYVFLASANDTMETVGGPWTATEKNLYLGSTAAVYIVLEFRRVLNPPPIAPIAEVPPEYEQAANQLNFAQMEERLRVQREADLLTRGQ